MGKGGIVINVCQQFSMFLINVYNTEPIFEFAEKHGYEKDLADELLKKFLAELEALKGKHEEILDTLDG